MVIIGYQAEIDNITRRTKYAESSFLTLYKVLADAPDPAPLFEAAIVSSAMTIPVPQKFTRDVGSKSQECWLWLYQKGEWCIAIRIRRGSSTSWSSIHYGENKPRSSTKADQIGEIGKIIGFWVMFIPTHGWIPYAIVWWAAFRGIIAKGARYETAIQWQDSIIQRKVKMDHAYFLC